MTLTCRKLASPFIVLALIAAACGGQTSTAESELTVLATTTAAPTMTTTTAALTTTTTIAPLSVISTRDVIYATQVRREVLVEWTADLHVPTEPGTWPALVFVPGQGQGPSSYYSLAEEIAAHGVAVLVINYPGRSPTANPNKDGEGFREVAGLLGCANRFVRHSVEEAGSELDGLVVGGMSLGGGVAAHAALAGGSLDSLWQEFSASRGLPPLMDCVVEEGSTHVDALVGVAGAYDAFVGYEGLYGLEYLQGRDMQVWELLHGAIGLNPDLQVRLLHGRTDGLIPYENSEGFVAALTASDVDVVLTEFEGGHSLPHEETVAAVLDILGVNGAVDS